MKEQDDFFLIHSPGDYELWKLCKLLVEAVEWRPEPGGDSGVIFEHTVNRYFEKVARSERHSAEWFYHNKTSFETKYDEDCGDEGNNEPAWVSDDDRGSSEHYAILAAIFDRQRNPSWLVFWRRKRLQLTRKRRAVHDALAVDWRSRPAAKLADVSQPTVDLCKKIFKTHFAQCHTAWKRDFVF